MGDWRQPYASTAMKGLQSSPDRNTAIDVVAAASQASTEGTDLWKSLYSLEKTAHARLRDKLIKKFREHYRSESEAERIVDQAIHEYYGPGCRNCEGTGQVGLLDLGKKRAICPECSGTKLQRFSDATRSSMMRLSYKRTQSLAHKIGWVIRQLSTMDIDTNKVMNGQMGND